MTWTVMGGPLRIHLLTQPTLGQLLKKMQTVDEFVQLESVRDGRKPPIFLPDEPLLEAPQCMTIRMRRLAVTRAAPLLRRVPRPGRAHGALGHERLRHACARVP